MKRIKSAAASRAASQSTAKPSRVKPQKTRAYHHGNLRQAMIEATLALIEDGGLEKVTVRDAARRAGVSSGAPFRHFPNRDALLLAVAEEAQRRFRAEIADALKAVSMQDPLEGFRAIGRAYLDWAIKNPTYFKVISDRALFNYDQASEIKRDNDEVIDHIEQLLMDAKQRGQLRAQDLRATKLAGRAMVYGLARMAVDGHLPRWGIAKREYRQVTDDVLDVLIAGIAK